MNRIILALDTSNLKEAISITKIVKEKILEIIFLEITGALCEGKNIEIRGFGTYKIVKRKARIARNPKNSELVQIPKKKTIKWKISKTFFNRLNKNFTENKISDIH